LSHVQTDLAEEVAKEIKDEIRDVKTLLVSGCEETNETRLEEVAREIRNETDRLSDEIKTLLQLVFSTDPSNLPNVFELVRSFISFHFDVQLAKSSTSEILWQMMLTLAAHALAPLALSAARCEKCRFVPEMIA